MTEPPKRGRPPLPGGPKENVNFRVPKELKRAAFEVADERHESLSYALEAFLHRYVTRHRARHPKP